MAALVLTLVLGTATSATAEENAILVPGGRFVLMRIELKPGVFDTGHERLSAMRPSAGRPDGEPEWCKQPPRARVGRPNSASAGKK